MSFLSCFKTYDVRGKLGSEINIDILYRIGRAFAMVLKPETVVVGFDARETSSDLKDAICQGLIDEGVSVYDIGLCGTEEIYFATSFLNVDGGIMITASHNPIDYNGIKFVGKNSKPITNETGLLQINQLASLNDFQPVVESKKGKCTKKKIMKEYIDHLLSYIDLSNLSRIKIVVNSGNGPSGRIVDELEKYLPFEFIKINHHVDSSFPNGIPNPLIKENRFETIQAVKKHKADFGIAWDGDFDRCFLFDESGKFVEGYYIVGLLAKSFLNKKPSSTIIFDPRLTWNTQDVIKNYNGVPFMSKTGHAYIKENMRKKDAVYGGEMSAHHYFKDFYYCDSGMIPWLLIAELICVSRKRLSSFVLDFENKYPVSGEINQVLNNPEKTLEKVRAEFFSQSISVDNIDGLSMEFKDWRFNLRRSNTESLVRLNVETRGDIELLKSVTESLLIKIKQFDDSFKREAVLE